MAKAVFQIDKGTGSGSGLGNHIDRAPGREHSYPNADLSKTKDNENYIFNDHCRKPLAQAIKDRISEGYNGKRVIRNDAVKYLKIILSGSRDAMHKICENPKAKEYWIQQNQKFIVQTYGEANVVRFTVHLDETTPHIHAVVVPLTKDGRLSAKEIIGNKGKMKATHDKYHEYIKKLGLERGLKSTLSNEKPSAKTLDEFYTQINRADKVRDVELPIPKIEKPSKLDMFSLEKWTQRTNDKIQEQLQETVKDMKDQLSMKAFRTIREVQQLEKYRTDQNLFKELKNDNTKLKSTNKELHDSIENVEKVSIAKRDKQWHNSLSQSGLEMDDDGNINIKKSRGHDKGRSV